jgi:hypothetical protein
MSTTILPNTIAGYSSFPTRNRHFALLSKKIVKGLSSSYPTLVHITGLRTKKFKNHMEEQKVFLRKALHINDKTEMMTSDISWWDVAQPTDARGRKLEKTKNEEPVKASNNTIDV